MIDGRCDGTAHSFTNRSLSPNLLLLMLLDVIVKRKRPLPPWGQILLEVVIYNTPLVSLARLQAWDDIPAPILQNHLSSIMSSHVLSTVVAGLAQTGIVVGQARRGPVPNFMVHTMP